MALFKLYDLGMYSVSNTRDFKAVKRGIWLVFILILHEINQLNSEFELSWQARLSHPGLLTLMLTSLRVVCGLPKPLRMIQTKQIPSLS